MQDLSSLFLFTSSFLCHFFCSTAPQAFFRPNHVSERLARAGHVKAGRSSRPPKAWPLHDRARRQTGGVGPERRLHRFVFGRPRLSFSAGYIVLFAVECRSPHHGPSKASAPQCPERDHKSVAGRITRSPRPVPAGTTFRQDGERVWRQCVVDDAGCQRNGCPVVHIRCRMTASLRATAMVAFLLPTFFASPCPHACNAHGRQVRLSRTFAPS